ncbi:MAG: agmatine deiminase family protein, partial [Thiotrichales bacterium]|nr:agmatine deiminase family protein [Thiotrichales bacterium]
TVVLCMNDETCQERLLSHPGYSGIRAANLRIHTIPNNDCWVRDYGPVTILENNSPVILDFVFNGWNNKYPYDLDNSLTRALHESGVYGEVKIRHVDSILEGGSIETNGKGCLITTSSCLTKHRRNPGYGLQQFETLFDKYFGCGNTIWLECEALAGDDTDGHVDTLLRFCPDDVIIYQACDDDVHPDFATLNALEEQLKNNTELMKQDIRLVPVPTPEKIHADNGHPLPASYVNFIITNDAVLLPVYGDKSDSDAAQIIAGCFPGRETHAIDARPLLQQGGSLHCASMQLPAGLVT